MPINMGTIRSVYLMEYEELVDFVLRNPNYLSDSYYHDIRAEVEARAKKLSSRPKFKQMAIAFGKYLSGYRPATEGWGNLDQKAMEYCLKGRG